MRRKQINPSKVSLNFESEKTVDGKEGLNLHKIVITYLSNKKFFSLKIISNTKIFDFVNILVLFVSILSNSNIKVTAISH